MAECPICSRPLSEGPSIVYQDDRLIHAGCWATKPDGEEMKPDEEVTGDETRPAPPPGRSVA